MIQVNIPELEGLAQQLTYAASDSFDALCRLRVISDEMHNDLELLTYPQAGVALEAICVASDALQRGDDTLQSLKNTVQAVIDSYEESERRFSDALARMSAQMDRAQVGCNAALVSDNVAYTAHDEPPAQLGVRRLVADSVEEMQIANIAAVTKAVKEEYGVSRVEPLSEADA